MKITARTDYSTLFNSLPKNNKSNLTSSVIGGSSDLTSLISDYSSIKSGSYGKLMKAYYAKDTAKETSKDTKKSDTTSETKEEDKKDTVVTIGGKEIDTSKIDLSKSKVKPKSSYTQDATYSANTNIGDLLDTMI